MGHIWSELERVDRRLHRLVLSNAKSGGSPECDRGLSRGQTSQVFGLPRQLMVVLVPGSSNVPKDRPCRAIQQMWQGDRGSPIRPSWWQWRNAPVDPLECHRLISRRVRLPVHHVFAKDVLGINLYALQAVVAANAESINSTYFIPGNLFARPRSQPSACRK